MTLIDRYIPKHFEVFIQTPFRPQPPFNSISPYKWAREVLEIDRPSLPKQAVDRFQVRQLCQPDNDVLDGYLSAMAWGAQESGPSGKSNAQKAWSQHRCIQFNLKQLQEQSPSRTEAYELFHRENPIRGLGVSYFTKLLYFFTPATLGAPDRYIMDKWTGMSMNLLTGEHLAHIARIKNKKTKAVDYLISQSNTAANYETFCSEVDALAHRVNQTGLDHVHTGEDIEQMLFSLGSMVGVNGRTKREPWRAYVHTNWETERPLHRYSRKRMLAHRQRWASDAN